MASGFKVGNDDFDDLFEPIGVTSPGADTGYSVNNGQGVQGDIANRYRSSTGGDQLVSNTGYKLSGGSDLKTRFRALSALVAPTITGHPSDTQINENGGFSLSITATGSPAPTYQWQKDNGGWGDIPGATSSTYNAGGALSEAGFYRCIATNSSGSATSNIATVTIFQNPYITSHPSSVNAEYGTGPYALVCSAGGDGTLFFRWFQNGSPVTITRVGNVDSDTDQHVFSPLTFDDAGSWFCRVTNSHGGTPANSNAATVTVNAPTPPTFTLHPQNQSVRQGSLVTFSSSASGTAPISYQWQKNGSNISGQTSANLFLFNVQNADEGSYRCVATNAAGSTTSNSASLNVVMDPVVTSGPGGPYTRLIGEVASISITATGDDISYQWRKNGSNLSGQTSSSLTFVVQSAFDSGNYDCVVSNPYTFVISPAADIAVYATNPTITDHPDNISEPDGTFTALFCSANIRSDEGPVFFRWFKDGVAVTARRQGNIQFGASGIDQHTFTVNAGTAGSYLCVVSTDFGGVTNSNTATVTVT